ncbi:DUF975 family protein [Peribacillus cavernae]|uniref:DUF975 family protein n=2 Tax=Peribacillus cavernae TaxID=1674310 RepID=A0A433HWZ3_9BACI|nr:DUF975 family protein [Peribacillus cavernae]RUQ32853.1 DUF975 family protein [Peribacillus cavernae]
MSISQIKKQARTSLKGQWGVAVLLTFILFLLTTILPSLVEIIISGGFTNWSSQTQIPIAADILNIVITIALIPLSTSAYWFYLTLSRLEGPQISQVFAIYKDGRTSFKVIGASILVAIFVFLWSLLLIIPGIIKSLSYSQTFFLLRDHPEFTVLEAITESKNRMKGYKWKFFLMNLSFIGWGILCVITLGIGILWLAPYIATSMATFYNELIYTNDDTDNEENDL